MPTPFSSVLEARKAEIRDTCGRVAENVARAAIRVGRDPAAVTLMAVSKTVAPELAAAAADAGIVCLGENKVQELAHKHAYFSDVRQDVRLELIGHLQSNKAAKAVALADRIQSVDSYRLAEELSNAAVKLGKDLPILLEVNIGDDPAKFGFSPSQTPEIAAQIAKLPALRVEGLMTVLPFGLPERELRTLFLNVHKLALDIESKNMDNISMGVLSMGMSEDYEIAIACGATLVRVGSAIFGRRYA